MTFLSSRRDAFDFSFGSCRIFGGKRGTKKERNMKETDKQKERKPFKMAQTIFDLVHQVQLNVIIGKLCKGF